jgi:hypothetical protein
VTAIRVVHVRGPGEVEEEEEEENRVLLVSKIFNILSVIARYRM